MLLENIPKIKKEKSTLKNLSLDISVPYDWKNYKK